MEKLEEFKLRDGVGLDSLKKELHENNYREKLKRELADLRHNLNYQARLRASVGYLPHRNY